MGKKRVITSSEAGGTASPQKAQTGSGISSSRKAAKKQVLKGTVNIASSYNNTLVSVADPEGNVFAYSSAGTLGFKGARKSTPYAATLVGKDAIEKARKFGLQEVKISIKGIGPGREAAIRGVASSGINIIAIIDRTPMPHNGVRPTKPRRV